MTIKLSAKKTYKIVREVRVPLRNTVEKISSRLDMSLTFTYAKKKSDTLERGKAPVPMSDETTMDFALTGNYNFTKSITGLAKIAYGRTENNKIRSSSKRFIEVTMTVTFRF